MHQSCTQRAWALRMPCLSMDCYLERWLGVILTYIFFNYCKGLLCFVWVFILSFFFFLKEISFSSFSEILRRFILLNCMVKFRRWFSLFFGGGGVRIPSMAQIQLFILKIWRRKKLNLSTHYTKSKWSHLKNMMTTKQRPESGSTNSCLK